MSQEMSVISLVGILETGRHFSKCFDEITYITFLQNHIFYFGPALELTGVMANN